MNAAKTIAAINRSKPTFTLRGVPVPFVGIFGDGAVTISSEVKISLLERITYREKTFCVTDIFTTSRDVDLQRVEFQEIQTT